MSILQILLDEALALEIADEWQSPGPDAHEKSKIALRNFHLLRLAARNKQAESLLNGKQQVAMSMAAHMRFMLICLHLCRHQPCAVMGMNPSCLVDICIQGSQVSVETLRGHQPGHQDA